MEEQKKYATPSQSPKGKETVSGLKNVFKALDTRWLLRHYFYAIAFDLLLVYGASQVPSSSLPLPFIIITTLFYPFAMFLYESIVNFLVGDNFFILSMKFMLIWKFVRFCIIWFLSVPIGIIGFIYIYFKVNKK